MSKLTMNSILTEYLDMVDNDLELAKADFFRAKEYIKNSSAIFTRGQLSFLGVPKMLSVEAFKVFEDACKTVYSILEKVIFRYLNDEDYRTLFPFSKELEELILLPCGYDNKLPIARLDTFFNENDYSFKFCEFNADGASAMNEDRELFNAWKTTKLFNEFSKRYNIRTFELFDSFVDEFLIIYDEFLKEKGKNIVIPNVAIVDFLGIATKSEFEVFKKAFEKRGCKTVIEDVTKLRYRNNQLYDSAGNRIDAIYRRAVTGECMQRLDEISDLLQAVKDGTVCLVGGFRTQVIHDKTIFKILRDDKTKAFLNNAEIDFINEHIPKTYLLKRGEYNREDVFNNKNKYLIKPTDKYGSSGVAPGVSFSVQKWRELVDKAEKQDYIVQEYCKPFKARNFYFDDNGSLKNGKYNNMTGMFVYAGKLKGLYTRSMQGAVTTKRAEGRVVPTVVIEEK